jgi:hypothetical protein
MLVYFIAILVCFVANRYVLWQFDTFHGYLVYFSRFGMLHQEKSGSPVLETGVAPGLPDFSWYNIPKQAKYTK